MLYMRKKRNMNSPNHTLAAEIRLLSTKTNKTTKIMPGNKIQTTNSSHLNSHKVERKSTTKRNTKKRRWRMNH